jgi:hypothetical protein
MIDVVESEVGFKWLCMNLEGRGLVTFQDLSGML